MPAENSSDVKFEIGHVLFLDIVGYSKLLINEQRERLQELNEIVRNTAQFRTAEANGHLMRIPTGDGMALVFRDSAETPVRCAMEISQTLKGFPNLPVRMGIHSGPVSEVTDLNQRANVAGAGINMAQRVMDCGDAGHILLSQRIAGDLGQYRHWEPHLHELGECEVKHGVKIGIVNLWANDVGNPALPTRLAADRKTPPSLKRSLTRFQIAIISLIALISLGIPALIFAPAVLKLQRSGPKAGDQTPTPGEPPVPEKSIAVLPFADLSQAKDQEYFCDGMSEEILDSLSKIEGLRVVARTSSFSFKGKTVDVGEIAQKLGVQNILEGSVRRDGNRVRITAQLINARDGFHLWSQTYEREMQSVFKLQDEITRAITDALKIKLVGAPRARSEPNSEAYDLFLQGMFFSNKSSEADLRRALDFFQRALEKDPNSARAWAGVAKVWTWMADAYVRPADAYPKVKEAALKAVQLDDAEPDGHIYVAEVKRVLDWDVSGGDAELYRALHLDPNSAMAHFFLAMTRAVQGKKDESLKHIRASLKADPLSPLISNFASVGYLCHGLLNEAIEEGKRTLQLDPNFFYGSPALARAYREKGMLQQALDVYTKAQQATGAPQPGLAIIYAETDREREARQILQELEKLADTAYFPGEEIASVYIALGETDEAFKWLNRACDDHSGPIHAIAIRPEFRPLHSDPRFAAILKRIGLEPSKILSIPASAVSPTISPKSIAVLPFENLSDDKANAYFADGVQEEILTRLSKISALKVISRTSTQKYRSKPENLRDIAQQLGVANIVEGSVQRAGDQVRVTVQLINAETDSHLWAEKFDRKLTDIFAVESEIAKAIADSLQAKLTGSEQQAIAMRPTQNTEAHQLYLKGRFFWNKTTGADLRKAIDYFSLAIDADPNYALAFTGLTDAYLLLPFFTAGSPQECYPKAKEAALTALQLDDTLAEAHLAFAQVLQFYDFKYAHAETEFRRGLELNPNSANGHWRYSWLLAAVGRSDEALAEIKRAVELDPLSLIINTDLGYFYMVMGQPDEAVTQLRRTMEMEPNFYYAHGSLGQVFAFKGEFGKALAEYKKLRELNDDPFVLALLTHVYAASGDKAKAREVLGEMQAVAKTRYLQAYAFAIAHAALGEKEEAIRWLEQSYRDRAGADIAFIRIDPLLAPLRGNPRFEKIAAAVLGEAEATKP